MNNAILGDFNTPLTPMERSFRQKSSKKKVDLSDTLEQMELTDIYIPLHPRMVEYTFFSSTRGALSRTDHMLNYKANLKKFKKIEIISITFS